ncbi:hypothetical protein ACVWY3_003637 [Bradyrhizobium sp. USDA 4486]
MANIAPEYEYRHDRNGSKAALGVSTRAFRLALGSGPCEAMKGSQPRANSGRIGVTRPILLSGENPNYTTARVRLQSFHLFAQPGLLQRAAHFLHIFGREAEHTIIGVSFANGEVRPELNTTRRHG